MLQVSTKSPTHDITLTIDDEPVRAHVKRFTKEEGVAFLREFARASRARGAQPATDEAWAEREAEAFAYLERTITAYITFEPGDVMGDDGPVVTGAQIVEAFRFRLDVLAACQQAVFSENCLGKAQKKILNSRHIFSPGSTPSIPTPSGPERGRTARDAGSSSSAASEDAMGDPGANGKARGGVH